MNIVKLHKEVCTLSNKYFALIGHPIAHSMSPFIHKRLFELSNIDADYRIIDIAPENLSLAENILKGLDGFNITIPHKQSIIPILDELSQEAKICNSVNTVKNDGKLIGYTTDTIGFSKALEANNVELKGRVVILGAGGAAWAIANQVAQTDCEIVVAVRKSGFEKAEMLVNKFKDTKASVCLLDEICGEIDLLINATPVGMFPNTEEMPINKSVLSGCKCVFDAIYNPDETMLMREAKKAGIKAVGGMDMLVWQAVAAHQIWNGSIYNIEDIIQLCQDTREEMKRQFCGE